MDCVGSTVILLVSARYLNMEEDLIITPNNFSIGANACSTDTSHEECLHSVEHQVIWKLKIDKGVCHSSLHLYFYKPNLENTRISCIK